MTFLVISSLNAEVKPAADFNDMFRPQALHFVVVTPGGILLALTLYFLPQYRQVISRVSVFCPAVFAGTGFGEGSSDLGFNEMT